MVVVNKTLCHIWEWINISTIIFFSLKLYCCIIPRLYWIMFQIISLETWVFVEFIIPSQLLSRAFDLCAWWLLNTIQWKTNGNVFMFPFTLENNLKHANINYFLKNHISVHCVSNCLMELVPDKSHAFNILKLKYYFFSIQNV